MLSCHPTPLLSRPEQNDRRLLVTGMFFSLASLAPGQIQHQHSTDTGNLFHSSKRKLAIIIFLMLKNKLFTILTLLRQSVRSYWTPLCTINVTVSETDTIKCNVAQIYFLIKNNQLVQDSFSGFFYSLVSLLYIARSRRLYILGKLYNFRLLLIKKIINPPHFRHKQKKRKRRNYIHVFTCNYLRNSK